jgi:adenylate cyclase
MLAADMATARTRRRIRQLAVVTVIAGTTTPIFNYFTAEGSVINLVQGAFDGVFIPLLVAGYLLFIRDGLLRRWFRDLGFWPDLALSSTIVLVLFLGGRAIGQVIVRGEPRRFVTSFTDTHLLYALPFFAILAVAVQFILQMNRLIGTNVLGYFLAGVYRQPTSEERVFLFLDLEGSTKLAERLGSARYFQLLRRFVDDVSEPVLDAAGEIYQYAGDEVVITWTLERAVRAANCVGCFFSIRRAIERGGASYEADFGAVPRFRGGLHGGTVTAGEIGDARQQIVFVGDILNTAARLEEYAKREGLDLVMSGALLDRLTLPPELVATPCGHLEIRGKEARVTAYSVASAARR